MSGSQETWGSDVPISMPEPTTADNPGRVPMFGFVMTDNGLWHDLNEDDHERLRTPAFAPLDDPSAPVQQVGRS